jgi:hypothetical protein
MSVPHEQKVAIATSEESSPSIVDHGNGTLRWPYRIGNMDNSDDDEVPGDSGPYHEQAFTIVATTTIQLATVEHVANEEAKKIDDDETPSLPALIDSEIVVDDGWSSSESDLEREVEFGENTSDIPTSRGGIGGRIAELHSRVHERLDERRHQIEEDKIRATEAAVKATVDELKALSLMQSTVDESAIASFRASKLSITVVRDDITVLYGVGLDEMVVEIDDGGKWKNDSLNPKTKVFIDRLGENGLLHNSPLEAGDVLQTVNNKVMTEYQEAVDFLVSLQGPVTMTVETPKGHPNVMQAFGRKPTPETKVGVQFDLLHYGEHAMLQVKGVDSDGLLANSLLSAGHLVLAINGTTATTMCPEVAAELVESSLFDVVNILVMDPQTVSSSTGCPTQSPRWIHEAQRMGIALGGGAMVGVGLIFIPILPPPFGEALIIGGVSVLGTEFAAPKHVMRSARDSLERAVGRNVDAINESKVDGGPNDGLAIDIDPIATMIDEAIEGDNSFDGQAPNKSCATGMNTNILAEKTANQTESELVKKTTVTDRFKNFGRNYVLPFLDQVVGDREDQDIRGDNDEDKVGADQLAAKENGGTLIASAEHANSGSEFTVCDHDDYLIMDDYLLSLIDDAINGELDLEEENTGIQ